MGKVKNVLKKVHMACKKLENSANDSEFDYRAYNHAGVVYSLSNFVFGLTEALRREKFPFLKNIGTGDQIQAIKYVLEQAIKSGKDPAKALNASGLGYRNWKTIENEDGFYKLQYIDTLGNEFYIEIETNPVETSADSQERLKNLLAYCVKLAVSQDVEAIKQHYDELIDFINDMGISNASNQQLEAVESLVVEGVVEDINEEVVETVDETIDGAEIETSAKNTVKNSLNKINTTTYSRLF